MTNRLLLPQLSAPDQHTHSISELSGGWEGHPFPWDRVAVGGRAEGYYRGRITVLRVRVKLSRRSCH